MNTQTRAITPLEKLFEMNAKTENEMWELVLARDAREDGNFVFAVSSTHIYCRPSCPSRRPLRENVTFYNSPDEAERAGYRSCLRCKPREFKSANPRNEMIERVCRLLEAENEFPINLEELAKQVGLSPFHLQKTFKHAIGVSPREYKEAWRLNRFKLNMQGGADVTSAMYDAGFGSSSRLYEKSGSQLGMTPGTYGRGGIGLDISFTIVDCPLGKLLVAATERGLCSVTLGDDESSLEDNLTSEFNKATIKRDPAILDDAVKSIISYLAGNLPQLDLPLDIKATAFQKRVWEELQRIPYGSTRSYSDIAEAIHQPSAVRAVASACASNPVALVIPCHRVVRRGGEMGGYRWGIQRKKKLLAAEKTMPPLFKSDSKQQDDDSI